MGDGERDGCDNEMGDGDRDRTDGGLRAEAESSENLEIKTEGNVTSKNMGHKNQSATCSTKIVCD